MNATAMTADRPLHIVHTEASCGWGGQEIRILTEAKGMIDRGHRVEIWAPERSDIFQEAARRGIPRLALPIEYRTLRGLVKLRSALTRERPDVVNTHSSSDTWLAALACLTLRHAPPIVRTRHISAPVPKDVGTRWLYRTATSHLVTTGEQLRRTLISDNGVDENRVTSIPTGVDASRFRPGDRMDARRQLKLEPACRYIGIVATLRSWKGHLYLIDAFARIATAGHDLRLLVVGDGPMSETLRVRVDQLQLASKVIFAGRQEAVEQWLRALDIFCLPSYANEGVPQALIQAMLTALPIVTTPVGAIPEAITDGATGVLVPGRDVDALADALQRLLVDSAYGERLGAEAREVAKRQFAFDAMLNAMERLFRDVVERSSKRGASRSARVA